MHLSVKGRIAIAMAALVLVNAATAGFAWYYQSRAAQFGRAAREQSQLAQRTETASRLIAQFVADGNALALTVSRSHVSEDSSVSYGRAQGSERDADAALRALAAQSDSETAAAIAHQWEDLRLTTYYWINREAESAEAPLRITQDASGRFRASVASNLNVAPALVELDNDALRRAARDKIEVMKSATLRNLVRQSEARAAEAAQAETHARNLAAKAGFALIGISFLVGVVATTWLYRTIARPLAQARAFANRVAAGDLAASYDAHTADEIGTLTRAIESMKDAVVHRIDTMREMAGAVLVTADGVSEAAMHAQSVSQQPTAGEALADDIAVVVDRAAVLQGLASQMLAD